MARKKQEIALQKEIETQEEWEELMHKEGLFVVDVYQEWCGPCKSIVSIFRRIKNETGDDLLNFAVAKSNTIDSLERYRGKCQPCFLFYGSGTLVDVIRGANPPDLEKTLKNHLEHEHKVLKGEAERVEFKDPAFKELEEAEKRALAEAEEEEDELEKEVTVVLIKPDAVKAGKVDEIVQKLEERGIEILEMQERQLTDEEARDFYRHLSEQDWFDKMISYMISGPSQVLVVSKGNEGVISEFRELLGPANATEAKETAPDSLRAMFGSENYENALHGADSGEKAAKELAFFFPEFKVPKYKITKKKKGDTQKQVEYTVALLRHDAYAEYKDDIINKIKQAGFEIAMTKEIILQREQVEEFYKEHKDESFFEELVLRMTNGPLLALVLSKENAVEEWRQLIGEKDPKIAKEQQPDSLRAVFSKEDIPINLIHGSDSKDSAIKELNLFFPMERTLAFIKPDAYENKEEIIEKIKESKFTIAAKKDMQLTREMAEELYKDHKEKDYFNELIEHLISGTTMFFVLSKQDAVQGWRKVIGEVDPNVATENEPDSIRALYGKDIKQNAVHGSSTLEEAERNMNLIFGDLEFKEDGKAVGYESAEEEEEEDTVMKSGDEHIKMEAQEAQQQVKKTKKIQVTKQRKKERKGKSEGEDGKKDDVEQVETTEEEWEDYETEEEVTDDETAGDDTEHYEIPKKEEADESSTLQDENIEKDGVSEIQPEQEKEDTDATTDKQDEEKQEQAMDKEPIQQNENKENETIQTPENETKLEESGETDAEQPKENVKPAAEEEESENRPKSVEAQQEKPKTPEVSQEEKPKTPEVLQEEKSKSPEPEQKEETSEQPNEQSPTTDEELPEQKENSQEPAEQTQENKETEPASSDDPSPPAAQEGEDTPAADAD